MNEKYTLSVDVQSTITGNVCIFQEMPDTNASKILTLAWLSKRAHHGTQLLFDWTLDYNFKWGTKGSLGRTAHFAASQTVPANLSTNNQISFNYEDGAYKFSETSQNPSSEVNLYINQGGNVKSNDALVGIGMSGSGSFVVESQPNLKLIFRPKPVYYVIFGDFIQGQIMDITELSNVHKLVYDGTTDKHLTLTDKNVWKS